MVYDLDFLTMAIFHESLITMLIHISSRVPVQRGESLRAPHLTHSKQTQLAK